MSNLAQAQLKRFPAAERRVSIARAAGPLFARHGYAGTSLDDVAAAVGVTKPIVYRHFDSKKDLYLALLRKHRDDLPPFADELEVPSDRREREAALRTLLSLWLDYVRENHHAWSMLFRDSSGDDEIRAARREVNLRAREVMEALVSAWAGAEIPDEQVGPTAEILTSGLAGMVLWWADHPEVPTEVLLDAAMRLVRPAFAA